MLERLEKRWAGLKNNLRVAVLRYLRVHFPVYLCIFLSLFTIPCHVANRIERLQHNILWGGEDGKGSFIWWAGISCDIRLCMRGLGFQKLLLLIMLFWVSGSRGLGRNKGIYGKKL
jgi:hypothetical protein